MEKENTGARQFLVGRRCFSLMLSLSWRVWDELRSQIICVLYMVFQLSMDVDGIRLLVVVNLQPIFQMQRVDGFNVEFVVENVHLCVEFTIYHLNTLSDTIVEHSSSR